MACTVMGLVVNSQCDMAGSTLMVDPAFYSGAYRCLQSAVEVSCAA